MLKRPRRPRAPIARTSEDLVAEHAQLIQARETADTRGARQGATRRIRIIERELLERGVEFEPAGLERAPRRPAPAELTNEELLVEHAALIERYRSADTAGVKAGATRRIRQIEASLRDRGVDFEPAGLDRAERRPAPAARSAEELLAAREQLVRARAKADTGGARQGLSRRIRGIERELAARGVDFEPATLERPSRRPPASESSTEELLAKRAELIDRYRSADTAGVKAGATRRIRTIEATLHERGVD